MVFVSPIIKMGGKEETAEQKIRSKSVKVVIAFKCRISHSVKSNGVRMRLKRTDDGKRDPVANKIDVSFPSSDLQ